MVAGPDTQPSHAASPATATASSTGTVWYASAGGHEAEPNKITANKKPHSLCRGLSPFLLPHCCRSRHAIVCCGLPRVVGVASQAVSLTMRQMRSAAAVARWLAAEPCLTPALSRVSVTGHSRPLGSWADDGVAWSVAQTPPAAFRGFAASTSESAEQSVDGIKAKIRHVLGSQGALNSDELWEQLEREGVRSKTFMKRMLQQMKSARSVATINPIQAQEQGYGDIKPAKVPSAAVRGKKTKGQKFKMVYTLKE